VAAIETSITNLQRETGTLKTQVASVGAAADGLNIILTTMERGRTNIYLDLLEIVDLAEGKVRLVSVSYGGSLITMAGTASNVDNIYEYARALRESPRFSSIWVNKVGGGFSFQFSLTK
jgi:hypothetical protein